jgi:hypothetical protein
VFEGVRILKAEMFWCGTSTMALTNSGILSMLMK